MVREYKGWLITGRNVHGMWSAWRDGYLRVAADTLTGLREAIRAEMANPR